MSWSYRSDRSDELYGSGQGPAVVPGASQAEPPGLSQGNVKLYPADGAIDVRSHTAVLTKGSAGAYTLAAPTADGIVINITNGSAFAHVVTATGLFQDGVTGGAKNAYTAAAFVGGSLILISYAGKWNTLSLKTGAIA